MSPTPPRAVLGLSIEPPGAALVVDGEVRATAGAVAGDPHWIPHAAEAVLADVRPGEPVTIVVAGRAGSGSRRVVRRARRAVREGGRGPGATRTVDPARARAAGTHLLSPFDRAAVLVPGVEGVAPAALALGDGRYVEVLREHAGVDGLAALVAGVARWCGCSGPGAGQDLAALAADGRPAHLDHLRELADVRPDGSVVAQGSVPDEPPAGATAADLAASAAALATEATASAVSHVRELTGVDALCVTGGRLVDLVGASGVGLDGPTAWVAPGDGVEAVGAALWSWHTCDGQPRALRSNRPTPPALPVARRAGGPEPRSAWRPPRSGSSDSRVGARAAARWAAAGLLVALLVAAVLVARARDDGPPDRAADPFRTGPEVTFSDLPAFAGAPFADALQREQRELASSLPLDPVTGTSTGSFTGTYTTVRDGERTTRTPDCPGCPGATAWLVGGSAAFGLAQRDQHTIASELVRLAEDAGVALTVRNLAVPGWTAWQELQEVRQRLEAGEPAPDLVLSYGGFNDVAGVLTSLAVDGGTEEERTVLDPDVVARYVAEGLDPADAGGIDHVSEVAAARYRRVQREMSDLAGAAGADVVHFFQPDAMASPVQLGPVAGIFPELPDRTSHDYADALQGTSRALAPDVIDLRHIYDDEPTSLYADWAHVNERGARLAAEAIWSHVEDTVREAAR